MSIFASRKHRRQAPSAPPPLTLRATDGTPLCIYPPEVVASLQRMIGGLRYRASLPGRIGLVAALRGEGVTYTTLALATVLASDLGASVCAVELNLWTPGMQEHLASATRRPARRWRLFRREQPVAPPELPSSPGLAAVLTGAATLDEALIPTDLPNLALLPAGELIPELRPAAAHSDELKACLDQLRRRFAYLLLDIPAVLAASDAIALASLADACCVVSRQGVTPVNNVRQALDDLKHLPMLGVVLNQVRIRTPAWVRNMIPQE